MASVYVNTLVTISADAAVDCQAGFLDKPARLVGPSAAVPYKLSNVLSRSCEGIMHVREKGPLMRQMPVHGWHPELLFWSRHRKRALSLVIRSLHVSKPG
jgi:hypothetical protein